METIEQKVKKLLALASSSNENEARNAALLAAKLIQKYGLKIALPHSSNVGADVKSAPPPPPSPPPPPYSSYSDSSPDYTSKQKNNNKKSGGSGLLILSVLFIFALLVGWSRKQDTKQSSVTKTENEIQQADVFSIAYSVCTRKIHELGNVNEDNTKTFCVCFGKSASENSRKFPDDTNKWVTTDAQVKACADSLKTNHAGTTSNTVLSVSYACNFTVVHPGINNREVAQCQTWLDALGYNIGPTGADGVYGNLTAQAWKACHKKGDCGPPPQTYAPESFVEKPYVSPAFGNSSGIIRDDPWAHTCPGGSCYGVISPVTGHTRTTYVHGYYRSNGTYVGSHYRSK